MVIGHFWIQSPWIKDFETQPENRKPRGLVGVGAAVWWVTYILYLYQMILDIVDIMQQIPGLILDILLYICRQHAVVVFPLQYLF